MAMFDHAPGRLSIDKDRETAHARLRGVKVKSPFPPRGGRGLGMGGTSKLGAGVGSALPKAMRYTLLVIWITDF